MYECNNSKITKTKLAYPNTYHLPAMRQISSIQEWLTTCMDFITFGNSQNHIPLSSANKYLP